MENAKIKDCILVGTAGLDTMDINKAEAFTKVKNGGIEMKNEDYLPYKNFRHASYNDNLNQILYFLAIKYHKTSKCIISQREYVSPNRAEIKNYICDCCFKYFEIRVTKRQINYLLRRKKGKFPYTAIVIIETLYNLIEEDREKDLDSWHRDELRKLFGAYLLDISYEEFTLDSLAKDIANKKNAFMESKYWEIFSCFDDSRIMYSDLFQDVTFKQCIEGVPVRILGKEMIPKSMKKYQNARVYFK